MKQSKIKRVIAGAVTAIMALTMCLGMTLTSFAEDAPATVAITKSFQMPEGTTTPAAQFTFTITPVSVDGADYTSSPSNMPAISGQVAFTGTDAGTVATGSDVKIITKNTGDILAGVPWPHAGIYEYTITEKQTGAMTIADANKEALNYSQAEYKMLVFVAEADNTTLYVKQVFVNSVLLDNGQDADGTKVDAADPGDTGAANGLVFTNTYIKTMSGGENPNIDDPALSVNKKVAGEYADTTKDFAFTIKITNNTLVNKATYDGTIFNSDKTFVRTITVTAGTATDFQLRDGQTIVFMETPVGTHFDVSEAGASPYTPSVITTTDGSSITSDARNGEGLAVTDNTLGEKTNSAAFTNTYEFGPSTGLILTGAGAALLLVAAGLATAYTVRRRRLMKG